MIRIFPHEAQPIPQRCHQRIQPLQQGGYNWKCPMQSTMQNVWTPTGWHHCTRAHRDTSPQGRIHTIKIHARLLEAHMVTHQFHVGSRFF
jgi:hypothetical protein